MVLIPSAASFDIIFILFCENFLRYIPYTVFELKNDGKSRDYEVNVPNIKLMYPDKSHLKFLVMSFNYVNTSKLSSHI
jgi:hypothetical protein